MMNEEVSMQNKNLPYLSFHIHHCAFAKKENPWVH